MMFPKINDHQKFYDVMNLVKKSKNDIEQQDLLRWSINHIELIEFYLDRELWEFEDLMIFYIRDIVKIQNNIKLEYCYIAYWRYNRCDHYYNIMNEMLQSNKFKIKERIQEFDCFEKCFYEIKRVDRLMRYIELVNIGLYLEKIFTDENYINKFFRNYDLFVDFYKRNKCVLYDFFTDGNGYNVKVIFGGTSNRNLCIFIYNNFSKFIEIDEVIVQFTKIRSDTLTENYEIHFNELVKRNYDFGDATFICKRLYRETIYLTLLSKIIWYGNFQKVKFMLENIKNELEL